MIGSMVFSSVQFTIKFINLYHFNLFMSDFFSGRLQIRSVLDTEDEEFQMWESNNS